MTSAGYQVCITLDITNLKEINRSYGHLRGNDLIREFSLILQTASSGLCFVGRNGGNEFIALFENCSREKLKTFLVSRPGSLCTLWNHFVPPHLPDLSQKKRGRFWSRLSTYHHNHSFPYYNAAVFFAKAVRGINIYVAI